MTSCWRDQVVPVTFTEGLLGRAGKSENDQQSGHWPCQKLEITQLIWDVCTANIFLLPFPLESGGADIPKEPVMSLTSNCELHVTGALLETEGLFQEKDLLQIDTKTLQSCSYQHLHQEK